jgi:hypothetical protein
MEQRFQELQLARPGRRRLPPGEAGLRRRLAALATLSTTPEVR